VTWKVPSREDRMFRRHEEHEDHEDQSRLHDLRLQLHRLTHLQRV